MIYEALLAYVSEPGKPAQALAQLLVGIITGIFTCTFINPLWVVKYRMIATQARRASGKNHGENTFLGTFTKIVQLEGVPALYFGVCPSWFGSLCGAVQFLLHAIFKRSDLIRNSQSLQLTLLIFLSGCLSSLVATVITFPYQVIR